MAHTTAVLTVEKIIRLSNTRDGNPRYKIKFTSGIYWLTEPDSTLGYEVAPSMEGRTFQVDVTGTGRITDMREVK